MEHQRAISCVFAACLVLSLINVAQSALLWRSSRLGRPMSNLSPNVNTTQLLTTALNNLKHKRAQTSVAGAQRQRFGMNQQRRVYTDDDDSDEDSDEDAAEYTEMRQSGRSRSQYVTRNSKQSPPSQNNEEEETEKEETRETKGQSAQDTATETTTMAPKVTRMSVPKKNVVSDKMKMFMQRFLAAWRKQLG